MVDLSLNGEFKDIICNKSLLQIYYYNPLLYFKHLNILKIEQNKPKQRSQLTALIIIRLVSRTSPFLLNGRSGITDLVIIAGGGPGTATVASCGGRRTGDDVAPLTATCHAS